MTNLWPLFQHLQSILINVRSINLHFALNNRNRKSDAYFRKSCFSCQEQHTRGFEEVALQPNFSACP